MAHNFIKVSLLHTPAVTNDYDIICLTETFLDPSIDNDDDRISIPGCNLLRADHPSNTKRRKCYVSLHAYIDSLAKHPMNLRISVQALTYSCQMLMTSTQHVQI